MNVAVKRQLFALVAFGSVAIGSTAHAGLVFNDHYYETTGDLLTWQQAEGQAVGLGGHLAAITSQAEQDFLTANFAVNEDVWIGLTDQITEGVFLWTTGEAVTYTAFFPGEPNNLGGDEDFVNMNLTSGLWNDNNPDSRLRGVIELNFNPTAVPEPSTLAGATIAGLAGLVVARCRRKAVIA